VRSSLPRRSSSGAAAVEFALVSTIFFLMLFGIIQIGALAGPANTYVKVVPPSPSWAKAKPLVVCALVRSDGLIGFLPMPNGGWVESRTEMSIEQDTAPPPTGMSATSADPLPAGASWSGWC
jgi:hypothetical protein